MKKNATVNKLWAFVPIKPLSDFICFASDLHLDSEMLLQKIDRKKRQAIDLIYHDYYDEDDDE